MRSSVRSNLIGLVVALAVFAVADNSWAAFAGGSRLIFYFTQRSVVNPAAPVGSAATIIGITNQNSTNAVNVRVNVFNGSTCASFGPSTFSIGPRRILRLNISDLVLPQNFSEGFVDVYAVNAVGTPIRWDQMMGKGTILDFGGTTTTAATFDAAALFSDADRSDSPPQQGTVIASNTDTKTEGALAGTVDFWAPGGPFGTSHRLVVVQVATTPGAAPSSGTSNIIWTKVDGTQTRNAGVAFTCMIASSLADLHPAFAATYPNTTSTADGGNLNIGPGGSGNKGVVGWLIETAPIPALTFTKIQQAVGPSKESHE